MMRAMSIAAIWGAVAATGGLAPDAVVPVALFACFATLMVVA